MLLARFLLFEKSVDILSAKSIKGAYPMLRTIIIREVFESVYSYRFLFFLIIGLTLIPIGLYVNEVNYSKRVNDYNEQVSLEKKAVSSAKVWDLLSGTVLLKGFPEPAPLAIFAQGLESSLPQFYTFKPGGYEKGATPSSEGVTFSELGVLDFAFIVQLVVSIIVLIFGADVVSGEKELGTLRGILSNSVPRDTVLFGKLIGGYAAIWFPFALAFVGGLLVLSLTSFPLYSKEILTRLLLIFGTSSVFMFIYFSIGVMISSSTARTRTSLIAVVVAWTFLQLIVPKVSNTLAALIYPIKTETVVSMERSLAVNALESEKSNILGREYQKIFGVDTIINGDIGLSPKGPEWDSFDEKIERSYEEKEAARIHSIDESYQREKEIQQGIETDISLISPSSAFDNIITGLCNTGISDKDKYADAVKKYQQVLDRELFSLVKRTTLMFQSGRTSAFVSIGKVRDPNSLPVFSARRAGLAEIFSRNVDSLISLTIWLIVPFAIAYKKFVKYDVR